ncbi:MAG: FAD-binding protein [Flavisolibacter sp.]
MPVKPTDIKSLSNLHGTFRQSIDNLFNLFNSDSGSIMDRYNETTKDIQQILSRAEQEKRQVRAMGANWSFTKVAYNNDWILSTTRLNMMKRILPEELLDASSFQLDHFLFCQCGCAIQEISKSLKPLGRALSTSGASNGQTIAGASGTGTHGAALNFGAVQDFIVGLHIIVGPQRHVYLEPASRPIVSQVFLEKIQAELIRDDSLFAAALVAFGSFGFIHGMMLETEPLYLLNAFRLRLPFDSVRDLLRTLDFSSVDFLPFSTERPFHFQFLINPYDLASGIYMTVMYKRNYRTGYSPPVEDRTKAGPGEDAPAFLGRLTGQLPVVTPLVVNKIVHSAYEPYQDVWGTLNEIFSNTDLQGRILSTAIGIPAEHVNTVSNMLLELNKSAGPFVGVFAFRYVKKSKASLAFTKFDTTCVVELDSVEFGNTRQFYESAWQELEQRGIPHSFHWGKINNLDPEKIKTIYGTNRDEWVLARNKLLSPSMREIFSSETLYNLGLDEQPLLPV